MSRGRLLDAVQEEVGEEEVAKVVDTKRQLKPVDGCLEWNKHHSSVADEHMNGLLLFQDELGERSYGVARGEV